MMVEKGATTMDVNNEHRINGYVFSIKNIKTIRKFYRGVILISYRSDIKCSFRPSSVVYTPGAFQTPEAAEIEALAYVQDLISSKALATILDA
jgi:hypothetical protein